MDEKRSGGAKPLWEKGAVSGIQVALSMASQSKSSFAVTV
jgi:hypothetical protein